MGDWNIIKTGSYESGVERSHQYRYLCARGFVDPTDIVIDASCGCGYGTEILSMKAKKAIGIDRDQRAILHAMEHHKRDNNYFMELNLDQVDGLPECDVAVSIETIEHLRFPKSFASKLKLAARKKIFVTCPIVPTKHEDPTHLHDFTISELNELFVDENWASIDGSIQGIYLLASFYRKGK